MFKQPPWPHTSAKHRWYGMGRYYAMFPPRFAFEAIEGLTHAGDCVLDPFCGRGNAPYTATVMDRPSFGIDINPVAWLYTAVKLNPDPRLDRVVRRLKDIGRAAGIKDRRSRSRFETMAWSPTVRAFLKAARRELDWRSSMTDRTVMAFIVLHMQDKRGHGLSNALWPTIACSPHYAVRWWTAQGLTRPPDIDPIAVLEKKIRRRYAYGTPSQSDGTAILGDAEGVLRYRTSLMARLLITSPPYKGVTDYWNDHWIRLWALGHSLRKDWKRAARYENHHGYRHLLERVFVQSKRHLMDDAFILVRSDRRHRTAAVCREVLQQIWPDRLLFIRESSAHFKGVSMCHGRGGSKAQELDFLLLPDKAPEWIETAGFIEDNDQLSSRETAIR